MSIVWPASSRGSYPKSRPTWLVGLQDGAFGAHDDHGVGGGLDERPEVGGVAALVLQCPGALEAVPGVGGQELEGGDLVVLDAAVARVPPDQDGGELPSAHTGVAMTVRNPSARKCRVGDRYRAR